MMLGGPRYAQFVTPALRERLSSVAKKHGFHPIHLHAALQLEFEYHERMMKRRRGLKHHLKEIIAIEADGPSLSEVEERVEAIFAPERVQHEPLSLQSLKLRNFGVFKNSRVSFSSSPDKPVVLIGGANGSGKTTLFQGILTALYGLERGWNRKEAPLHRGSIGTDNDVELELEFTLGQEDLCVLKRRYTYEVTDGERLALTGEKLSMMRGGKLIGEGKDVEKEVDSLIPVALSGYFFFDADSIRMFIDKQAEALKQGLESVLGIEMARRLLADVDDVVRESSQAENDLLQRHSGRSSKELLKEMEKAQLELKKLETDLRGIKEERKKLTEMKTLLDEELRNLLIGFNPKSKQEYERLRDRRAVLLEQRKTLEAKLSSFLNSGVTLHLLMPLIKQLLPMATSASEGLFSSAVMDSHARAVRCFKENNYADADLDYIFEPLSRWLIESDDKERMRIELTDAERAHLREVSEEAASHEAGSALLAEMEKNVDELAAVEQKLKRMRPPSAQKSEAYDQIRAKEDRVADDLTHAKAKYQELRERSKTREDDLEGLKRKLERAVLLEASVFKAREEHNRAKAFRAMIEEAVYEFRKSRIEELEQEINRLYRKLTNKPDLHNVITLDADSFEAFIVESERKVPFAQLAEGEKQIVSMALVGALCKVSGRRFPVVIDTPFGRLDRFHRMAISQSFLKDVSHQVVVLSTDAELTGEYLEEIRPYLSHSFLIQRSGKGREHTEILEGYFK